MDKMFNLKCDVRPRWHQSSLWFKGNFDGEKFTIEEIDENKNKQNYKDNEGGYRKEKEYFDAHKDFLSYNLCFCGVMKNIKTGFDRGFERTINIGKKTEITKEEVIELWKKEAQNEINESWFLKHIKDVDWKTVKCDGFESKYDMQLYGRYISNSRLMEEATQIVEKKVAFEKVIKDFDNKEISTEKFIKEFLDVYSFDKKMVIEKIVKNRYKNPEKFKIKTEFEGPMSVWSEGHGRDFSYEITRSNKWLDVYAEKGTKIDTEEKYTIEDLDKLKENKNLTIIDGYDLFHHSIKESSNNITQKEVDEIIKNNITKEMLLNDYKGFMNYFNLSKIEIGLRLKENREKNEEEVKKLQEANQVGDNAIKLLDENKEMKL